MGSVYAKYITKGEIPNAELAAVYYINSSMLEWAKNILADGAMLLNFIFWR
ncbi:MULTISPECIES: hypothetical protein [Thermoanaerobacter]|uniref:hypothetical protein n=1 Tax=Thermoanaerobacter TaxID=1754 RepID=UPI0001B0A20D|nr:hypothetical protein [Thermoanaerobacter italicus]